jgi:peptidoglycan biosynthesis protein MviN/MurJ (putative lipid II flippase)
MLGEIFFAIYYNLSVWYKITDKTYWGMRISAVGCAIILLINILFVREYSYRACAWAIPAGGFVMMLLSYFIGQRKENFPVQYPVLRLALYALLTGGLFWMGYFVKPFCSASLCHQFGDMHLPDMLFNTVLLAVFVAVVVRFDFPLKEMLGELSSSLSGLPVVGKFFKKKNQK